MRPAVLAFCAAIICGMVANSNDAAAETFVGSNVDSRVIVGVTADSAAVEGLLPEGWTSVAFPDGPMKGANLLVVFIDGILEMDAEGQPLDPASRRAAGLVGLGKKDDAVRLFVMRFMTTAPDREAYGVGVPAEIERTVSLSGPSDGARRSMDQWRVMPQSGGEIALTLDYTTGKRGWSSSELFPHSAANPDFSRIYRYRQLSDLVLSTGLGKPASGEVTLEVAGTEWDAILDGSQETVAVVDVPVYVREIFLP